MDSHSFLSLFFAEMLVIKERNNFRSSCSVKAAAVVDGDDEELMLVC